MPQQRELPEQDGLQTGDPDERALMEDIEAHLTREYDGEIGGEDSLVRPDVDLTLHPSRRILVAGELWSITGVIHNRSSDPIWIVDTKTVLTLAPEMYGQTSKRGSIVAFFPTVMTRPTHEVVRLDPGAQYNVVWKIDLPDRGDETSDSGRQPRTLGQILRVISGAIRDYLFFDPGKYRISSTVHVWSSRPQFRKGMVANVGASYPVSVEREIEMEASPWVLILGAAVGGIICFLLQLFLGVVPFGGSFVAAVQAILGGLSSAVILCGVGTVLISRLAKTDFLVVIKVKDLWGAIATGFIIQWFGYEALVRLLPRIP